MTDLEPAVPPARRRADAQINRDRIMTAARAAFADPDADVSMAEIARRSGVGSATLYRNFPDRRALLEALYGAEITAICRAAATVEGHTAMDRLDTWLRRFHDYFTSKRALAAELLEHTDSDSPVFTSGYQRIVAAAGSLVDAALADGDLRQDLTVDQILALVAAVAGMSGDSAFRAPILRVAMDGLRRNE